MLQNQKEGRGEALPAAPRPFSCWNKALPVPPSQSMVQLLSEASGGSLPNFGTSWQNF